jgi:hypothetical protein
MYIEKRPKRAREDACIEGELRKDGGEEGRKKREGRFLKAAPSLCLG